MLLESRLIRDYHEWFGKRYNTYRVYFLLHLLIIGWGYQPERLQAGVYIIIYTITGSLPLLGGLLYIYIDVGSLCIFYNMGYRFSLGVLGPFL